MYGRDSFYNEFGSGSASLYEIGQPGKPNCSDIPPLACHNLPIERPIKAAGLPEGGLIDRTAGDPDKELSLQLSDYDVNEWRAGQKDRHRLGLERIMKFIIDRRTEILKGEGIEITISGAASRTGTKEYNDRLSCKRAACVAVSFNSICRFPSADPTPCSGKSDSRSAVKDFRRRPAPARSARSESSAPSWSACTVPGAHQRRFPSCLGW